MSYSPRRSPSQDSYPQSGKPVGGYGGEDPPQRSKSRDQKRQQASPARVLTQGHLPESNNPQKDHYPENYSSLPGYQSSHNQTHKKQPVRDLSQGYNPTDNDLSNHQSPFQSHKQVITSIQDPSPPPSLLKDSSTTHRLPVPSESSSKTQQQPTTGEAPVKQRNLSESSVEDHGEKNLSQTKDKLPLQPTSAETNSKVEKPNPQLPETTALSRKPLPVPEGYPPSRPPTSPSKMEPRPKKGLLEKICCCFF